VQDAEIEKVYAAREQRLKGNDKWVPAKNEALRVQMQGAVFMKIRPKYVYYLNASLFGGDKKLVPMDMTKQLYREGAV
jgi:hypothetical protein